MKFGVQNNWLLNAIKSPSNRARTKLWKPPIQSCYKVVIFATRPNKVKYSTMKCKHFSAVFVYFSKVFREISLEKYTEFKEFNFYSMRARSKVLASFESQRIKLAFICISWRNNYLGQTESRNDHNISLFFTHAETGWLTKEKAGHVLI